MDMIQISTHQSPYLRDAVDNSDKKKTNKIKAILRAENQQRG